MNLDCIGLFFDSIIYHVPVLLKDLARFCINAVKQYINKSMVATYDSKLNTQNFAIINNIIIAVM